MHVLVYGISQNGRENFWFVHATLKTASSLLAHDMAALGWLLWNREYETPAAQLSRLQDPYQTYPGAMNRAFVGYIWGVGELLKSETYSTRPILSVVTDPVLSWAAQLWGGFPHLELHKVKKPLRSSLKKYLLEKASS